MCSKFPLALGSGAIGTWGPSTCPTMLAHDQVLPETKKPPFAFEGERGWYSSIHPSRPRRTFVVTLHAWVFWLPFRPTLRAFPDNSVPVASGGFRLRLQLRGSTGVSPVSPKHVGWPFRLIDIGIYDTSAVSRMSNEFSEE